MIHILIVITLHIYPAGSYGVDEPKAPTVAMQEFNSEKACQAAAKAIRDSIPEDGYERRKMVKMLCAPKA